MSHTLDHVDVVFPECLVFFLVLQTPKWHVQNCFGNINCSTSFDPTMS